MFNFVLALQYISIIVVVACILYMIPRKVSIQKNYLIIVLVGIALNQIGYTMELSTKTVDAALVAIRFAYIGKMVAELGMLLFVCFFCGFKISKWLTRILILFHLSILASVWMCDVVHVFYKSIDYTMEGFYPHVVLEHGPLYNVFTVVTIIYMIVMLAMCASKWIKATSTSEKGRTVCIAIAPLSFMVALLIYKTGITNGYDSTAMGYMFSSVALIIAMAKYELVDKEDMAKSLILDEIADPVFSIDSQNSIFYMNTKFTELFKNKSGMENAQKNIIQAVENNVPFEKGNRFYHVSVKDMKYNRANIGKIYVMHDITETHNYNDNLQKEVFNKTAHIREIQEKMIIGMASMVENRDANTGGHIKRTSAVVQILMEKIRETGTLGVSDEFIESIVKAAPMHDLGKIAVDDEILRKPGRYTEAEFAQMKEHAAKGAEIVEQLLNGVEEPYFANIAKNVAHYHHERYDGSGYPEHLSGKNIPLEARIMAIADVYDALVSKRCYKEAMSYEEAFKLIEDGMGTQFDPMLNEYFVACRESLEAYYNSCGK